MDVEKRSSDKAAQEMINHMAEKGQENVIVNKVVEGVEGSAAIVTDQKPELKFLPIGSGDLYVAELLKRGWDKIWSENEGSDTTYEIKEEQTIGGLGFFGVQLNKSKDPFGFIEILEEPPDDIYFDKNSRKRDFSDTPLIKAKMRSIEYIMAEYGEQIKQDKDIYFSDFAKPDENKSEGHSGEDEYTFDSNEVSPEAKKRQKNIWEIAAWMLEKGNEDWQFEILDNGDLFRRNPRRFRRPLPSGLWPSTRRHPDPRAQLAGLGPGASSQVRSHPVGARRRHNQGRRPHGNPERLVRWRMARARYL